MMDIISSRIKLAHELMCIDREIASITKCMKPASPTEPDMRIAMAEELLFLNLQRKDVVREIMEIKK